MADVVGGWLPLASGIGFSKRRCGRVQANLLGRGSRVTGNEDGPCMYIMNGSSRPSGPLVGPSTIGYEKVAELFMPPVLSDT